MGGCRDRGISFSKGAAGDDTVSQLWSYGVDELYRTVCDRCLYFFRFRVGLEPSGRFSECIGLPCLYGCADCAESLLAEELPLWSDGMVVANRNLFEMAAVAQVIV